MLRKFYESAESRSDIIIHSAFAMTIPIFMRCHCISAQIGRCLSLLWLIIIAESD